MYSHKYTEATRLWDKVYAGREKRFILSDIEMATAPEANLHGHIT